MARTIHGNRNAAPAKSDRASQREENIRRRIEQGGVVLSPVTSVIPYYFTPGSQRCLCSACGHVFSSVGSFDKHQLLDGEGNVVCWRPESIGLVYRKGVWGYPGDRPVDVLKQGEDHATQ